MPFFAGHLKAFYLTIKILIAHQSAAVYKRTCEFACVLRRHRGFFGNFSK